MAADFHGEMYEGLEPSLSHEEDEFLSAVWLCNRNQILRSIDIDKVDVNLGMPEKDFSILRWAIGTDNCRGIKKLNTIKLLIEKGAHLNSKFGAFGSDIGGWSEEYQNMTPIKEAMELDDKELGNKIVKLIQKKMKKNEKWDKRKDIISYRRNFRQKDPNRMILTKKYKKEEEDVGHGTGAAASGSGSSTGGRKKRRTRKHRGKKRKQTKRRKPKRRVKKRKQTKRRRIR